MTNSHLLAGAVATATVMMMLTGCGGSDSAIGSGAVAGPSTATNTEQSTAGDTFLAKVRMLIASSSDTSQPDAIESVTITTPENTSPEPLS